VDGEEMKEEVEEVEEARPAGVLPKTPVLIVPVFCPDP
jgi:hypothetical protein